MSIRLMIADDHAAVRAGVISIIQGTEIEVICQAETCEQTVKLARTFQPDVLLLDVRLADLRRSNCLGVDSSREPADTGLVLLQPTMSSRWRMPIICAQGYVPKGASREDLLKCIRCVAKGERAWTTRQMRQVVSRAAA